MERFALLLCAWSAGQPFERDTARSFGVTGVTDTLSTGYLAHCMFDTQLVASSMYALADAHFYGCMLLLGWDNSKLVFCCVLLCAVGDVCCLLIGK